MARLGYARISTHHQDLSLQLISLRDAGVQDHPDFRNCANRGRRISPTGAQYGPPR
jgi:DNA invertase Pin-like site-specific DNA recombinase